MMMQWGVAAVALIVGIGAGYYLGDSRGYGRGMEAGVLQGIADEKQADAARKDAAEREAAKAVNPFSQGANPLGNASANPFEDVKVNPFE